MRILFIIAVVLLHAQLVYSQEPATIPGLIEHKKLRKQVALKSISELKDGVLLVRLDFQQRKIDYYTKYKNYKEVERIKKKQDKINTEIVAAFNELFDFCNVYFFRMSDSRKLLDGKYDSVVFYNNQLEPDTTVSMANKKWFVAEFGYIEQDTNYYYSSSTPTTSNSDNPEGIAYYGGSKNNKSALVIRDATFTQLRDPFPYYVGFNYFGSVKKRYRLPVQKLNKKLHNYYGNSGE